MSNTVINAKIIDQKIQLSNIPLIASGSNGVLQIRCDFDNLWAGYVVTAVFFQEKDGKVTNAYHVPVNQGVATVPHEVLKEKGFFFLGFMGVAENTRTTETVQLTVKQGAITEATAVPDPTPDIYTQLLQIIQQSSIIPDSTLTQAGKAADAKATGEAIAAALQAADDMISDAIDKMRAEPIVLVRGVHYGSDDELATLKAKLGELPNGLFWGKVVG